MTSENNGNRASAAFATILAEFPQARNNLVNEITNAAARGDHNDIPELAGRLERADVLKNELEQLQAEWGSVFGTESIPAELLESPPFGENASVVVRADMNCAALRCKPSAPWGVKAGCRRSTKK